MKKDRKNNSPFGIGMASVLMIVMILALTTFGVLALVSALSDYQTSKRIIALTSDYYEAEKEIEYQIAEVDEALLNKESVFSMDGTLHLLKKAGEDRQLHVILQQAEGKRYEITQYKLENTKEWSPDDELHIWDGGE